MRLVLDTSAVVAAVRSSAGASNRLLNMGMQGEFEMLLSVSLLLEYEAVVTRPEQIAASNLSLKQIDSLLESIVQHSTFVHLGFFWPIWARDKDDSHVITLAVVGRADGLVTYNLRDFASAAQNTGINLYTPASALLRLRS